MSHFLDSYEPVEARIHRFWEKYPNGRIATDITELRRNEAGQFVQVIVKASVWRDIADESPAATDYAEETLNSSPVNRTSFVENCATSAIGRALSTLGFSPKGSRPSAEEMGKAERVAEVPVISAKTTGEKWGVGVENMDKPATVAQIQSITKRIKEFALDMNVKPVTIVWELGCMSLYAGRPIKNMTELTRAEASQIIEDASNAFEILRPKYLDLIEQKKKGNQ